MSSISRGWRNRHKQNKLTWMPALRILTAVVVVLHTWNSIRTNSPKYTDGVTDRPWDITPSIDYVEATPSLGIRLNSHKLLDKSIKPNRDNTNLQNKSTLVLLLVLGGDIEINPGPTKYPCKICNKPVAKSHRALQCDECDKWVHIKCGNVTPIEYETLGASSAVWICHLCGFANFSTSFGSTESIPTTDNSFSALEDEDVESQAINNSDKSEGKHGKATAEKPKTNSVSKKKSSNDDQSKADKSTVKTKNKKTRNKKPTSGTCKSKSKSKKPKFRKLKVLTINCRSLKSKRKQRELRRVLVQENPDIICGNEAHIDENFYTGEIFPDSYDVFRKDRNIHGGGVFIGLKRYLIGLEEESLNSDCESMWVNIIFAGKQPMYIGSFYRPTNRDPNPLIAPGKAVEKL